MALNQCNFSWQIDAWVTELHFFFLSFLQPIFGFWRYIFVLLLYDLTMMIIRSFFFHWFVSRRATFPPRKKKKLVHNNLVNLVDCVSGSIVSWRAPERHDKIGVTKPNQSQQPIFPDFCNNNDNCQGVVLHSARRGNSPRPRKQADGVIILNVSRSYCHICLSVLRAHH